MENEELVNAINKDLSIALPGEIAMEQLAVELAAYINQLIQSDFQKLISLLYRVDVSEAKLKQLLQQQPQEAAGKIIAALVIERQLQKISYRRQHHQRNDDFTEEEKW